MRTELPPFVNEFESLDAAQNTVCARALPQARCDGQSLAGAGGGEGVGRGRHNARAFCAGAAHSAVVRHETGAQPGSRRTPVTGYSQSISQSL